MRKSRSGSPCEPPGNYVSEWFGHRVYPVVCAKTESLSDQGAGRCPFLSAALRNDRECIKPASSRGICTISSCSNGPRQDWLVCPYRALDDAVMENAARRLFGVPTTRPILVLPAPALGRADVRGQLMAHVIAGERGVVYLQDKLGGEISIPPTDRSPELAFDITLVEISQRERVPDLQRYGILEVQTMDFHGSYRHAVGNLKDALRLHGRRFPQTLQDNQAWLCDRVEGPNIANVFKRTFYQMVLKFRIAESPPCAGCILAIPQSVWDSWQRHLGRPDLTETRDGAFALPAVSQKRRSRAASTWIYVFDIEAASDRTPCPITLVKTIAADADSLAHYALTVAPEAAVSEHGRADKILPSIRRRLAAWWPELAALL